MSFGLQIFDDNGNTLWDTTYGTVHYGTSIITLPYGRSKTPVITVTAPPEVPNVPVSDLFVIPEAYYFLMPEAWFAEQHYNPYSGVVVESRNSSTITLRRTPLAGTYKDVKYSLDPDTWLYLEQKFKFGWILKA